MGEGVLIPRADTETLVDKGLEFARNIEHPKILDLCCGSGCVGIAICKNLKNASLTSADLLKSRFIIPKKRKEKRR